MRNTFARTAATVTTLGVLLIAPATAAAADTQHPTGTQHTTGTIGTRGRVGCQIYLLGKGYIVGPKVNTACELGHAGYFDQCYDQLRAIDVSWGDALFACENA